MYEAGGRGEGAGASEREGRGGRASTRAREGEAHAQDGQDGLYSPTLYSTPPPPARIDPPRPAIRRCRCRRFPSSSSQVIQPRIQDFPRFQVQVPFRCPIIRYFEFSPRMSTPAVPAVGPARCWADVAVQFNFCSLLLFAVSLRVYSLLLLCVHAACGLREGRDAIMVMNPELGRTTCILIPWSLPLLLLLPLPFFTLRCWAGVPWSRSPFAFVSASSFPSFVLVPAHSGTQIQSLNYCTQYYCRTRPSSPSAYKPEPVLTSRTQTE